jgi:hypothetical protein
LEGDAPDCWAGWLISKNGEKTFEM